MPRYLLDTNILLRIADLGFLLNEDAVRFVIALKFRGDEPVITTQNLIEFWAVATRPQETNGFGWTPKKCRQEIDGFLSRFELLADKPEILYHWLNIVTDTNIRGKRAHDARLIAVMRAHAVDCVLTFDRSDFSAFTGIRAVDPPDGR